MKNTKTDMKQNKFSRTKKKRGACTTVFTVLGICLLVAATLLPALILTKPQLFFGEQAVLYDVDGTTCRAEVAFGKTFSVTAPTRPDFTFEGLYADPELTVQVVDAEGNSLKKYDSVKKEVVLYAKWTERPYSEVTYLVKDEPVSFAVTRLHEGPDAYLSVPAGTETEAFLCWECDGERLTDETGKLNAEWEKKDRESVTLRAVFTPICGITYDLGGGSAEGLTESYSKVTETFALPTPTRLGYGFTGWSGTEIAGTSLSVVVPKGNTGERSYVAHWEPTVYRITYDLNGGTNEKSNPHAYTIESEDITLVTPTRLAYDFIGWTNEDGQAVTVIPKGSTGDKAFMANWKVIRYDVTYDLNGGTNSESNPSSYTIESEGIVLAAPTRLGYDFVRWTDETSAPATSIPAGSIGNRSFAAIWSLHTYDITYDLNGGMNRSANPTSYTILSDPIELIDAQKNGYEFLRWTDGSGNAITSIPTGSSGNKLLRANWKEIVYAIHYDLNGGTNNDKNPNDYTIATEDIVLAAAAKRGYDFVKWTNENGDTVTTIPSGSKGDRSLTAKWSLHTYSITYNSGGGTNDESNPNSYTIESENIVLAGATKDGYSFVSWTNEDGQAVTVIPKGSTGDITLGARWSALSYGISYDLNGGTNSPANPTAYTIESSLSLAEPTRTGYAFDGWTGTGLAEKTRSVEIVRQTGARSYTANWTPITYTISYDLNGGVNDPNNPVSYTIESEEIVFDGAKILGYDFVKWTDKNGSLIVSIPKGSVGDKWLKANWSSMPTSYTITYILNGGTNSSANPSSYTILSDDIVLADPTKSGYAFDGWTDRSGAVVSGIPKGSTENKTFTAHYSQLTYTTKEVSLFDKTILDQEVWIRGSGNSWSGTASFARTIADLKSDGYEKICVSVSYQLKETDDCYQHVTLGNSTNTYYDETFSHGGFERYSWYDYNPFSSTSGWNRYGNTSWRTYKIDLELDIDNVNANSLTFKVTAENKKYTDFYVNNVSVTVYATKVVVSSGSGSSSGGATTLPAIIDPGWSISGGVVVTPYLGSL